MQPLFTCCFLSQHLLRFDQEQHTNHVAETEAVEARTAAMVAILMVTILRKSRLIIVSNKEYLKRQSIVAVVDVNLRE